MFLGCGGRRYINHTDIERSPIMFSHQWLCTVHNASLHRDLIYTYRDIERQKKIFKCIYDVLCHYDKLIYFSTDVNERSSVTALTHYTVDLA